MCVTFSVVLPGTGATGVLTVVVCGWVPLTGASGGVFCPTP